MRVYSKEVYMINCTCQGCKEMYTMADVAICDMGSYTHYYCIPCFNKTFEHKITDEMINERNKQRKGYQW